MKYTTYVLDIKICFLALKDIACRYGTDIWFKTYTTEPHGYHGLLIITQLTFVGVSGLCAKS